MVNFDIGAEINLEQLIPNKLLIQANSGGGKSYAIRKILEETFGKVQQIILDFEGEFSTLKEKYDYLVLGDEGDYELEKTMISKLPEIFLESEINVILDFSEIKIVDRQEMVAEFIDNLMLVKKHLWKPLLLIIDEAHLFAPQSGNPISLNAIKDIFARGRKRKFCTVIATQRLSKLNKDVAAECNNKIIGRTSLDVDVNRAYNELGLIDRKEKYSLRELLPGEFYGYGPAISPSGIIKFRVKEVITKHGVFNEIPDYNGSTQTELFKKILPKLDEAKNSSKYKEMVHYHNKIIRIIKEKGGRTSRTILLNRSHLTAKELDNILSFLINSEIIGMRFSDKTSNKKQSRYYFIINNK